MKSLIKQINLHLLVLVICILFASHALIAQNFLEKEIRVNNPPETVNVNGIKKRVRDNVTIFVPHANISTSGSTIEDRVFNFITSNSADYGLTNTSHDNIELHKILELKGGNILTYVQKYQNIRLSNNMIVIKIDFDNNIKTVLNNFVPITTSVNTIPEIQQLTSENIIKEYLNIELVSFLKSELVIHLINFEPNLCWEVKIESETHGSWLGYVNALTGSILEAKYVSNHIDGIGKVFNPNPTWTARKTYGEGNFINNFDATNADLEAEQMEVVLRDITFDSNDNVYKLVGPRAAITKDLSHFWSSTPDFSVTRDVQMFQAVMCYYHLDKHMSDIHAMGFNIGPSYYDGNSPNGMKFNPSANTSVYNSASESIGLKYYFPAGVDVDMGEDLQIISHEFGHGIHHWVAGSGAPSSVLAIREGVADFFGLLLSRDCSHTDVFKEFEDEYTKVFHWGGLPVDLFQRPTNYSALSYCSGDEHSLNPNSQIAPMYLFYSPLMKIYSDLGKEKTFNLFLEALPFLTDNIVDYYDFADVSAIIYNAALDLVSGGVLDENDLCIIYQHYDVHFCISTVHLGIDAPTGGDPDIYMKDTQCDNGTENNSSSESMWASEDIWVRNTNDGGLKHQNPEYNPSRPNYIYVRVRGKSCTPVEDATLNVYFTKASTGLTWPDMWDDYFLTGPNGSVLAGDKINNYTINIPTIAPGDETILAIPWYPPNPEDFFSEKHNYSLLARIVSSSDGFYTTEGSSVIDNARNNNNVILKNVSVFDETTDIIYEAVDQAVGPFSFYLGCGTNSNGGKILVSMPSNSLNKTIEDIGDIYLELTEPFKSIWLNSGLKGGGYAMTSDSFIRVSSNNFLLDSIVTANCNEYINVFIKPYRNTRFYSFDLLQLDSGDNLISGKRFEYQPENIALRPTTNSTSIFSSTRSLKVFPNPASTQITLEYLTEFENKLLTVYDISGRVVYHGVLQSSNKVNSMTISTHSFVSGLYFALIKDSNGKIWDTVKFTVNK